MGISALVPFGVKFPALACGFVLRLSPRVVLLYMVTIVTYLLRDYTLVQGRVRLLCTLHRY